MAFVAELADILIIFLAVVPYSAGEVFLELLIACYVSMAVLSLMVVAVIALIIWKRRLPDLPRAPNTVAAVLSYICDSTMLGDFEGCEYLNDRDLGNHIAGLGKKYVYSKLPGSDGQSRYRIDGDSFTN
jgi:hypothetical protein